MRMASMKEEIKSKKICFRIKKVIEMLFYFIFIIIFIIL